MNKLTPNKTGRYIDWLDLNKFIYPGVNLLTKVIKKITEEFHRPATTSYCSYDAEISNGEGRGSGCEDGDISTIYIEFTDGSWTAFSNKVPDVVPTSAYKVT